ncbi:hypothetical protein C8Q72DRAFT_838607 [Fomitopsis betulina]|nr:hypothetical protein C8Q72DRAFT_838607 [Fomitopsis betulina]
MDYASTSSDPWYEKAGLQDGVSPPVKGSCPESGKQTGTPEFTPVVYDTTPTVGQRVPHMASAVSQAVRNAATAVEDMQVSYASCSPTPMAEIASPKAPIRPRERQPTVDDDGFRRYHQADVLLRGLSRMREKWWTGTAQAEVDGQRVVVKRYEGSREGALERWKSDVEVLRRYGNGDMVRMLGYSQDSCTTPFIVLAGGQLRLPEGLSD